MLFLLLACIFDPSSSGGKHNGRGDDTGTTAESLLVSTPFSGTSARDGTLSVPVEINQGDVFQLFAKRSDGGLISVESLSDPNGREVVSWQDWTGHFGLSDAFYVYDDTTAFDWPIRQEDGPLDAGAWSVSLSTVDSRYNYEGNVAVEGTILSRPHPSDGALHVVIVWTGGLEQDPDLVAAFDSAVDYWKTLYAGYGVPMVVRTDTLDVDSALPSTSVGMKAYTTFYEGLSEHEVPVFVGELIDNDRQLFGEAGGIPGALEATKRSGIAVAWLPCAGGDGVFSQDDILFLGETMAHEVGHYLNEYHPVEFTYKDWDSLEDTPACTTANACDSAMQHNVMYAYPICDRTSCIRQDEMTDDQKGVLVRYPGVY